MSGMHAWISCARKHSFSNKEAARKALKRHKNNRSVRAGIRKAPIRVYYCSECDGWHLTSRPLEEVKTRG